MARGLVGARPCPDRPSARPGRACAMRRSRIFRVIDPETMEPVPDDGETIGELMFRGNVVMKGYLKNPKATEAAFRGGWFHSGDLGVRHRDK
ncbi:AMP-binding protein [Chenggangzhangella methanolivorans]|uniref:AMP-binding protein n=1 Tax=Chenggangzhangella methanolivorans TaxID=1437009 RepID=UPI0021BD975C|nr:AMP-binding protein [Chenggangzhangella methanolivorans]